MIRVGIPQGLLYYYYYPQWRAFWAGLGVETVLSPETNKRILDNGLRYALSEACLPVKLYFGHVHYLSDKVDYIFVPRLVSVSAKEYICPKFMGLPDMLRARLPDLPPLIAPALDVSGRFGGDWSSFYHAIGSFLGAAPAEVNRAFRSAMEADRCYRRLLNQGMLPDEALQLPEVVGEVAASSESRPSLRIGLLGHPYVLYDRYINMNLIARLGRMGAEIIIPESVPGTEVEDRARTLPKRLFWTLGKRMIGAALSYFDNRRLDGVIYLSSFGCGPESLVGELVERWARKRSHLPFMMLTLDEHTGEAGLVTRLEAFVEMIVRRRSHAHHLSPHGEPLYSR